MASSPRSEAEAYARYLIGSVPRRGPLPPPARGIVERYLEAAPMVISFGPSGGDLAVVGFARSHPWSLPYLDAASALVRRHGLLRSRLLLMTALLEASPAFADKFLPRTSRRLPLLRRVALLAMTAAARAALGLLLYPIARLHRP